MQLQLAAFIRFQQSVAKWPLRLKDPKIFQNVAVEESSKLIDKFFVLLPTYTKKNYRVTPLQTKCKKTISSGLVKPGNIPCIEAFVKIIFYEIPNITKRFIFLYQESQKGFNKVLSNLICRMIAIIKLRQCDLRKLNLIYSAPTRLQ